MSAREAHLDRGPHVVVVLHVHEGAAVMCGGEAAKHEYGGHQRQVALVASQLPANRERAHAAHASNRDATGRQRRYASTAI